MCSYKYETLFLTSYVAQLHSLQHFLRVEPVLHDRDAKSVRTDPKHYGGASSIKMYDVCMCLLVHVYACMCVRSMSKMKKRKG